MISCMAGLYLDDMGAAAQRASAARVPQPKVIAHERAKDGLPAATTWVASTNKAGGCPMTISPTTHAPAAEMGRADEKAVGPLRLDRPVSCSSVASFSSTTPNSGAFGSSGPRSTAADAFQQKRGVPRLRAPGHRGLPGSRPAIFLLMPTP